MISKLIIFYTGGCMNSSFTILSRAEHILSSLISFPSLSKTDNTRNRGPASKEKNESSGFTEAGLYQEAGIPAVVWGPGAIARAHTHDEYILRSQLSGFLEYLMRI